MVPRQIVLSKALIQMGQEVARHLPQCQRPGGQNSWAIDLDS